MRILQIASGAPPTLGDPCTIAMHGLSCALAQLGHQVQVLHASGALDEGSTHPPYPTEVLSSPSCSSAARNGWVAAGLRQATFGVQVAVKLAVHPTRSWDVICFHAATPALLAIKAARIRGVPTVFRYANPLLTQVEGADNGRSDYSTLGLPRIVGVLSQLIESSVVADASKVVVTSEFAGRQITKRFHISPEKVSIVPNGVDTESFKPLPRSPQLTERYGLHHARVVMCVARIAPYKNQLALVRAIPEILAAVPGAVFLFVGAIDDPGYLARMRRYIASGNLEDKVLFTDAIESSLIADYHCLADVFVLPSLAEGLPLALLEAMSCGRAIVASSLPQHLEVARQDDALVLADPGSAHAIAKAVVGILQDDALRLRLQEKARRLAVSAYDWKVVARTMLEACLEAAGPNVEPDD